MNVEVAPDLLTTAADTDEGFEVHPANWASLRAFLDCETQWRVAATMAGMFWLGLDYVAVDVVLRRSKYADPDAVLADLQVMEGAALKVFGESET